jgi:hypothetical protein
VRTEERVTRPIVPDPTVFTHSGSTTCRLLKPLITSPLIEVGEVWGHCTRCGVGVRAVVSGGVAVDPADRALPPVTDSPPVGMYMARSNSPSETGGPPPTMPTFWLCRSASESPTA